MIILLSYKSRPQPLSCGHTVQSPLSPRRVTEVVEPEAEGEPARVRVLQLLLALLHDGLEDGGGDVTVTGTHSDHTACQSRHTCHLNTHAEY